MTYSFKQIFIPSILIVILSLIIICPDGLVKILSRSLDGNVPYVSQVSSIPPQVTTKKQESKGVKDQQLLPQQTKSRIDPEEFLSSLKYKVLNEIIPIIPENLNISSIDCYNNVHLSPRLQSIITMDYFRFVKLNLKRHCTLWPDDTKCSERYVCRLECRFNLGIIWRHCRDCTIRFCEESDLPPSIVSQEGSEIGMYITLMIWSRTNFEL